MSAKTDVPIVVIVDSLRELPQVLQSGDSPLTLKQYLHRYGFDVDEASIQILSPTKGLIPCIFIGHTLNKKLIPGDKVRLVTRTSTVDDMADLMDSARDCRECQGIPRLRAPRIKRNNANKTWARVPGGIAIVQKKAQPKVVKTNIQVSANTIEELFQQFHDTIINEIVTAFKKA